MTRVRLLSLLALLMVACTGEPQFAARDVEAFLSRKYPYQLKFDFKAGLIWPWYADMPRGIAFRSGEFPISPIAPGEAILKHFPRSRFFATQVRTNEWHLNEISWPALVGYVDEHREPAAFLSLRVTQQSEFFGLFSGSWFASLDERKQFSEALGRLVLWYLKPPCAWAPAEVSPGEIRVPCRCGNLVYTLRVFFDELPTQGDSAFYSGAIIRRAMGA